MHLGGEVVVAVRDVVAVLDARLVQASEVNQELVARAAREGRLHGGMLSPGCRVVVLTGAGVVYTSTITASTLAKRMIHLQQSAKAWSEET